MHSICVVLFNLLLFNGCLTANINRESTSDEVQQPESSENVTQANAFNEDFQYAIFDDSDLEQILHFAKNPQCSEFVIKHIYPVKYPNYDINLNAHENELKVDHSTYGVYISGHDFFMDVIKYFHKSIHNLKIFGALLIDDDRSAVIHKHVNEYCSEYLNNLYLGSFDENVLNQFQKPFSNVEDLTLQCRTDRPGSIDTLNEIFPKVQRLHISYFESAQANQANEKRLIESDAPRMENLEILLVGLQINDQSDIAIIKEQHRKLFAKNAQIRTLSYWIHQIDEFIHVISENLPNLEDLTILDIHPDIQPVQFDNVRRLTVGSGAPTPIGKLSMPRLDSLEMIYCTNYENGSARDSWTTFFDNHQHLRQFNASLFSHTVNGFVGFAAHLPNVEEINMQSMEPFDIDLASGIIDNHENMLLFKYESISHGYPSEEQVAIFNETFGHKWRVSGNTKGWPAITFEKLI